MRILQFITELTPAGAERVVCELSKELVQRGEEVMVLSLMPLPQNDAIVEELRDSQIAVKSLNVSKSSPWRILGIARVLKEFQTDVVHSHLIHPNIIARFAKIFSSVKFKLINTVHIAERRPGKWWHFFCDRITFNLCDCQTAVSKAVRDFHSAKIAKSPDLMPVIYNGLPNIQPLCEDRKRELRNEWGFEGCAKVIGSVGRLDWQKGYDIFLQALPEISLSIPAGENWGIVILGEGEQRAELENIIDNLNIENFTITLPGFRKDAAECIGAFDLFVMPSRYEGFGLTLIEAMMQGVPILASGSDSLPELMEYYDEGKCIDFSDKKQLAREVASYMYNRFSGGCSKQFSVTEMTNQYLAEYSKSS